MKYILNRKEIEFELEDFPEEIEGLRIVVKSKKEDSIKIKELNIVDQKLSASYINKKMDKHFEKLSKLMNVSLEEEGDESTEAVLGEIQKLKTMLVNKYKELLIVKEYKELLAKLILMEEEYKIRYNQKIMFRQIMYSGYEENKNRSR